MPGDNDQTLLTRKSNIDLTGWQYRLVALSGIYIIKATLRGNVLGVLLDKPAAGENGTVCIAGKCPIKTDGSVSAFDWLMSDASGFATTLTQGTGTSVDSAGYALENDGGSGGVIEAMIGRTRAQL